MGRSWWRLRARGGGRSRTVALFIAALTAVGGSQLLATAGSAATLPHASGVRTSTSAGDIAGSLTVNGLMRTYLVHLPPSIGTSRVPLLLVFHGHGDTAQGIEAVTGFDALANQRGFIVVYPQGYEDSWNDGRGTTEAQLAGVDDVAFVRLLVHTLEQQFPIDHSRVYATGFSNGAMLTERLGCTMAHMFAAIAPVAGPFAPAVLATCHPSRPLPVLEIQGTADAVVPYGGGTVDSSVGGTVASLAATTAFWLHRDHCATPGVTSSLGAAPNDGSGVSMVRYLHCAPGVALAVVSVIGGAHEWPGALSGVGSAAAALAAGRPVTAGPFSASLAVWHFLQHFTDLPAS